MHNNIDFNSMLVQNGLISLSCKNETFYWIEDENLNHFIKLRNYVEDVSSKVVEIDNEVKAGSTAYSYDDINPYRIYNYNGKRFCICNYNNYNYAGLWDDDQRMPILYKTFKGTTYESYHFGYWLKKMDFVDLSQIGKLKGDKHKLKLRGQCTNIYKNKIKISVVIGDTYYDIKTICIDDKTKNVEVSDYIHYVSADGKIIKVQAADVHEDWNYLDVEKLNYRIYY
eukprot:Mrub_09048.p1 GENE.Mrub_09048~~Mrub_09048.p1  ORF type:complete len:244 (+),score=58.26 Mrub_09048:56-733(+)